MILFTLVYFEIALKMMAVMQQKEPALPTEFLVTGRTGRRNAMPDILDPPHAGTTTAGLPERLQQLATSGTFHHTVT